MLYEIDQNFSLHASKIPLLTTGMSVFNTSALIYIDSGLSCDTFNIIHITNGHSLWHNGLSKAVNHFRNKDFEFCIWIHEKNLTESVYQSFKDLSLAEQSEEIGMVLDLEDYELIKKESHSNIELVKDEAALSKYAHVIAENWIPTDKNVIRYFNATSKHYLDNKNGITLMVYNHKGTLASSVELFPTDNETVGVYGLATLKEFRGLGIGTSLMTQSLNIAKKMGFKRVVLQASEDGVGIYKKLGFKKVTTYFEFA